LLFVTFTLLLPLVAKAQTVTTQQDRRDLSVEAAQVVGIAVGRSPVAIGVNSTTNKIYVANYGSKTVTVIDGVTKGTTTVAAGGGPYAVAVNAVTNKTYVANHNSDNITVIDGATNTPVTVAAGTLPSAVAVNPLTNKIYVANYKSNNVMVLDG